MPRSPALVIDGYNLLQESGLFGRVDRRTALDASRTALLDFLTQTLPPRQLARSVIVFDAQDAPAGLPHDYRYAGLRVLFSRNREDADTLIERLLVEHAEPRTVLVVSSDHRLQRAARQCGAQSRDSGPWFLELREAAAKPSRSPGRGAREVAEAKPERLVSPAEKEAWLALFGPLNEAELLPPETPAAEAAAPVSEAGKASAKKAARKRKRDPRLSGGDEADDRGPIDLTNPFPPGYTDDLFDE